MPTYVLDASQTTLAFAVAGLLRTNGTLARVAGTVTIGEHDSPKSLHVTVDARSLQTGLLARDLHLRTATFLHARRYPLITYSSQRIEQASPDHYVVRGLLRLKGREYPLTLDALLMPDAGANGARQARVSGVLRRSALGIPRSRLLRRLMQPMIGDEIALTADVRANLASASASDLSAVPSTSRPLE
ncbi:MAG TPA: YceI family protein [Ktedonobacterales bacterium]|nr:YceI family protein [Ktedonobacterales bacterium]